MFRNNQLLQRSKQIKDTGDSQDLRPVAILADPYEAEAGILVPVLKKFGFNVFEARDGAVALDLSRKHNASLIIASVDMPLISGAQLCQKVREGSGDGIPFILISPKGAIPDKFAGHQTFATDYAQRPLNLEDFESRLNAVLRAQRSGPETAAPSQASEATKQQIPTRVLVARSAPIPPPPPNERLIADVKEVSLSVPPMETEPIDNLLTAGYLAEHDVRQESAALYKEAFLFVGTAIRCAQKKVRLPVDKAVELAKAMVASIASNKSLMMLATDRTSPFSFRQHSVNVAIVATRMAQTLRLPEDRQVKVCVAAMFHDLGSIRLPESLTSKRTGLTPEERAQLQKRPAYAAEMVNGYPGFEWLPAIVLQIYERDNGTGYPNGIRGRSICDEARVIGVADVFVACIHRRPDRAAMTGYRALEIITADLDSFGERIAKTMIRSFSVYPLNELVVLNTGEVGKVIDINTENPLRPIVRIIYSVEGFELTPPRVVDLARNSQLWITSAITPDEMPDGRK